MPRSVATILLGLTGGMFKLILGQIIQLRKKIVLAEGHQVVELWQSSKGSTISDHAID